ncbi:MAG: T9SS type A sorting domain-containing protein [Chitinophagales bacterium]
MFKTYYSIDSSDNNPSPFSIETKSSYIYMSFYSGYYGSFGLGLRKLNKKGESVLFKLILPNDSFDVVCNAIRLLDTNKILITGTNFWRKNMQSKAFLLLIDTNLNVLAEKNDSFYGYTNEIFRTLFYDYNGDLCTIHDEFTYTINPDSMFLMIRKVNPSDLSTSIVTSIKGYFSQSIIKTADSGYLLYTYSPLSEKQNYYDPVIIKFDRNWNKLWERNIGDYGKLEDWGYGVTRMVEMNRQYYCWRTSEVAGEIGFLYRLDENGAILNKWREKDSSFFQTLIKTGDRILAFGGMRYYYKGDWRIALHSFDSNFYISRQNYIGFRAFYDTCSSPRDSTLYHMDATRTSDGGFLIFNSGSSYGARGKVNPFGKNFDILFKTDSCGYTQGDTCKLAVKIDSIRYSTVYLSIDQLRYKVCGRRWYVDGQVMNTENLVHTFSDTGTYNIGIWGFAGATTDSTNVKVRINQLDSCFSTAKDTSQIKGNISLQLCEKVKLSIDKSLSRFCTHYWKIENKLFFQDSVSYAFPSLGTYPVYLIGLRGVTADIDTILVKVDCYSSISNALHGDFFEIYPNPINDRLHIKTSRSQNFYYRIWSMDGKEISNGRCQNEIDTRLLQEGIFYLQLTDSMGYQINKRIQILR